MKLISFPSLDDWWTLTPSDQHAESVQWQNRLQFVSCVKSVMKHEISQLLIKSHSPTHRLSTNQCSRLEDVRPWNMMSSTATAAHQSTSSFNMFNYWAKVKTTNMEPGSKGGNVFKVKKEVSHRTGPAEPPPSLQLCGAFSFWFWFCRTSYT